MWLVVLIPRICSFEADLSLDSESDSEPESSLLVLPYVREGTTDLSANSQLPVVLQRAVFPALSAYAVPLAK